MKFVDNGLYICNNGLIYQYHAAAHRFTRDEDLFALSEEYYPGMKDLREQFVNDRVIGAIHRTEGAFSASDSTYNPSAPTWEYNNYTIVVWGLVNTRIRRVQFD